MSYYQNTVIVTRDFFYSLANEFIILDTDYVNYLIVSECKSLLGVAHRIRVNVLSRDYTLDDTSVIDKVSLRL